MDPLTIAATIAAGLAGPSLAYLAATGGLWGLARFLPKKFLPQDALPYAAKEVLPLVMVDTDETVYEVDPKEYELDAELSKLLAGLAAALQKAERHAVTIGNNAYLHEVQTLKRQLLDSVEAWKHHIEFEGRSDDDITRQLEGNMTLIAQALKGLTDGFKSNGSHTMRTINKFLQNQVDGNQKKVV